MQSIGVKYLSKLDGFGEKFEFDLDLNREKLNSVAGALATIFMGVVVLTYAYLRTEVFLMKTSMDIL